MKALKVLLSTIVGFVVGAFIIALLAYKLMGVPVEEEVDNIGNLVVTAYGFVFGGLLGAAIGLALGLFKIGVLKKKQA